MTTWGVLLAYLIAPVIIPAIIGIAIKVLLKLDTDTAMRYGEAAFWTMVVLFFVWIIAITGIFRNP